LINFMKGIEPNIVNGFEFQFTMEKWKLKYGKNDSFLAKLTL